MYPGSVWFILVAGQGWVAQQVATNLWSPADEVYRVAPDGRLGLSMIEYPSSKLQEPLSLAYWTSNEFCFFLAWRNMDTQFVEAPMICCKDPVSAFEGVSRRRKWGSGLCKACESFPAQTWSWRWKKILVFGIQWLVLHRFCSICQPVCQSKVVQGRGALPGGPRILCWRACTPRSRWERSKTFNCLPLLPLPLCGWNRSKDPFQCTFIMIIYVHLCTTYLYFYVFFFLILDSSEVLREWSCEFFCLGQDVMALNPSFQEPEFRESLRSLQSLHQRRQAECIEHQRKPQHSICHNLPTAIGQSSISYCNIM